MENKQLDTFPEQTKYTRKYSRATWFEKEVALHLLRESSKSGRHNGLIRGSSIGSKCSRRLAYMILGYRKGPETAHQQYVLNMGNALHDMVQTWMSKMELVKAKPYLTSYGTLDWRGDAEGTIKDSELGIHGHYDGLTQPISVIPEIELPDLNEEKKTYYCALNKTGTRYLLEFKTITNKTKTIAVFLKNLGTENNPKYVTLKKVIKPGQTLFSDLEVLQGSKKKPLTEAGNETYLKMVDDEGLTDGALLNVYHQPGAFGLITKPKDEHIMQSTFYASQLKADKILVVYMAKDAASEDYSTESILNLPIKAFEFDVDETIIEKVKDKATKLWEFLETKSTSSENPEEWLPTREFHPDDFMSECKFCNYSYLCYPNEQTVKSQVGPLMKEYRRINLPMLNMKAFQDHSDKEWGRHNSSSVKDS